MANLAVVGVQWGDEGKGKIVDLISESYDIVARYQGGHNAGHTVEVGVTKVVFHLIPSAILHPDKICVIGNGVVVEPGALLGEIHMLQNLGVNLLDRLWLSRTAHVIMPYHTVLEAAQEARAGAKKIGTTLRGIGPAYVDKAARSGIRICDLYEQDLFQRIQSNLELPNFLLEKFYNQKPLDPHQVFETLVAQAQKLRPFVEDTRHRLAIAYRAGKRILFEGAQGLLLDLDHGTYPFVTSSNAGVGGVCNGTGVPPQRVHGVMGVAKAYATRVGEGPFPTEIEMALGEEIRERGHEYGASTGRPRRCGWFDAQALRYAVLLSGVNALAITKLDVLDNLCQIDVAVGYEGYPPCAFPDRVQDLARVKVKYKTFPGWQQDTSQIRRFSDLPSQARDYLSALEDLVRTRIKIVSVGPERKQTIIRRDVGEMIWLDHLAKT